MNDDRSEEDRFWPEFLGFSMFGVVGIALLLRTSALLEKTSVLWIEVILRMVGFTTALGLVLMCFLGGVAVCRMLFYPADSKTRLQGLGFALFVLEPLALAWLLLRLTLASRTGKEERAEKLRDELRKHLFPLGQ